MGAVLIIEQDTLVRELMREHVEREGHTVCAVSSVRVALDLTGCMPVALVLANAAAVAACAPEQFASLRGRCANVVCVRPSVAPAPEGSGDASAVHWSPFDLGTLSRVVARYIAPASMPPPREAIAREDAAHTHSGTFPAQRFEPRPEGDTVAAVDGFSVEALGALVLEATSRRAR